VTDETNTDETNTDETTQLNQDAYDQIAPHYAQRQADRDRSFPDLMDAFTARLPERARLADLGCGPAHDGARFAAAGHHVVGLDRSSGMLAIAARALQGRVLRADLRGLPLAAASLDGIWCSASLLHVPQEQTVTVLREMRRVLRPSGALALITALGEGSALEPVPYAPATRRWYFYRQAAQLHADLATAGLAVLSAVEQPDKRHWLKLLAG
jgi:ubiquinone/menaquinone biosynthesis C-methylase UbiE